MRARTVVACSFIAASAVFIACVGEDPTSAPAAGDGGTSSSGASSSGASSGTTSSGGSSGGSSGASGSSSGDDGGPPPCGTPNAACCAGNVCNGGSTCNGTVCACPQGQTACGTTCVDTATTQKHCGRCDHDCFGGACTAGKCSAYNVMQAQASVQKIIIAGDRIFWSRGNTGGGTPQTGGLLSAKLDGTDVVMHFDAGAAPCTGLTMAQNKIYVSCVNGSTRELRSCALPNCGANGTVLVTNISGGRQIAADPNGTKIFYAVPTPYNAAPAGGIFDQTGARVGNASQAWAYDIAVANGAVYWVNFGTYTSDTPDKNGGVERALLTNLATEQGIASANNVYFDITGLSVDTFNVYFVGRVASSSDVVVANAAGGGQSTFASNTGGNHVATDGTNVYFDDETTTSVRYCPRTAGCSAGKTLLSANESQLWTLGFDDKSVFWSKTNGEIRRVAKP